MLTISYIYRMLQRHDRSLRAKTERLFPLGIEQCRICQNRETINLWRRYCLEVNESITILSGDDVLALPHETYARSIERATCPRTIQYQQMEQPPDGWEPPGARSRKVDYMKKKWHELLSKCLSFFRMFFLLRWKETKKTKLTTL